MGGRAAEELILEDFTTGAGNDLERATELARKMVCEWGMSDVLGPLVYGQKEEQIFMGRDLGLHRDYSEETAKKIDQEIKRIVEENYEIVLDMIKKKIGLLHDLATELLNKEVLDHFEIDSIVKKFDKKQDASKKGPRRTRSGSRASTLKSKQLPPQ
jgi:cell division protease FtsH